ncbi:MAG: hypothetical protein ABI570_02280, partial [Ilumatobacteraceae bacterium]
MSDPAAHLNRLRNELDGAFQDWNDFETDLLDHHAIRLKDRDENWESRLTELEGSVRDASQVHSAINAEVYRLEQAEKASPNAQLPPLTGADALPEELRAGSLPFRPLTIDDVHNFETPISTTNSPPKSRLVIFSAVGLAILGVGFFALRSNDKSASPVPVTVVDSVALPSSTLAEVLPVLPQATTAAATGYSCVGDQFQLFDSSNVFLVSGGGGTPPTFSTGGKPYCLASISTYHWNDGKGAPPGKVGLRGTEEMVGPTQAQGTSGQGGAQNVNWVYVPASDAIPLLNGQYSCTDSDSATWSQN